MNALNFYRFLDKTFGNTHAQILMYHGFTDETSCNHADNSYGTHLNITTFAKQIQYLKDHYTIISLSQWVDLCQEKRQLPRQSVILTFDDGYESNYLLAFPVLKKFNVPATIFVTTNFIEGKMFFLSNRIEYCLRHTRATLLNTEIMKTPIRLSLRSFQDKEHAIEFIWQVFKKLSHTDQLQAVTLLEDILEMRLNIQNAPAFFRPLNWAQCREMIQSGLITIGAHTCSHPSMAACSNSLIEEEIMHSRSTIERNTHSSCNLFCYPYGGKDDFNLTTKELLKKHNFQCALTTLSGSNSKHSDLFELRRLGTSNEHSIDDFKRLLLQSYRLLRQTYKAAYQKYAQTKIALGATPK